MREQNRTVVAFPEIQADRSVPSADGHSAAWGSTKERRRKKIKREHGGKNVNFNAYSKFTAVL